MTNPQRFSLVPVQCCSPGRPHAGKQDAEGYDTFKNISEVNYYETHSIAKRCRVITLVWRHDLKASDAASTAFSNSVLVDSGTVVSDA